MQDDATEPLEGAFVDGFRAARDKRAFLALAGVPLEFEPEDGPGLKLLEVRIEDGFQVGSASPGFASRELVYQPLPGPLIRQNTRLFLVYVSAAERRELSLRDALDAAGR
jgi:hypothetical protein